MEGMSQEDLMEGMSQEDLMEGMSHDHCGVDEFVLDVLVLLAIAVCCTCVLLLKLNIADITPVLDFDPVAAVPIHFTKKGVLVGAAARAVGFLGASCLFLSSLWWNDGTKPLMAILPFFGYSSLLYHEKPGTCAWLFDWLTLSQGFLRILNGSGTATETCLFVWTISYTSGAGNLLIRHQVPEPGRWDSWDKTDLILFIGIVILVLFGSFWLAYQVAQLAWNIYWKVFAPLTSHMKQFLAVDLLSMIVFTCYCRQISGHVAVLVGCACLCVGWLLTGGFIYNFHMPHENQQELDQRIQRAGKIGVAMDVGGKIFTYACVLYEVHNTCPKLLEFFEGITTLAEAMIKWQHASRAHAREVTPGDDQVTPMRQPLLDV